MTTTLLLGKKSTRVNYNFTGQVPRDDAVTSFAAGSIAPLAGIVTSGGGGGGT